MEKIINNQVVYYKSSNINIPHCFTTKLGGVSTGYPATMNFDTSKDTKENVMENFKIISATLGFKFESLTMVNQKHTNIVVTIKNQDMGNIIFKKDNFAPADAMVTNSPGVTLVTSHADCLALYFYDADKKVIGLAHAGWRGTVDDIATATTEAMVRGFGCHPSNIKVAISPGIMACCFEVDTPVAEEFLEKIPHIGKFVVPHSSKNEKSKEKFTINLQEINKALLIDAGILNANIEMSSLCTKCNGDIFHSNRLSGLKRGSMGAMISLKQGKS